MKPLAIDLYCGLGGWAEGFLSEGYDVIGFDIEARPYPGQLVLQDVLTVHGRQFKDAAVIVGSSPCQEFSYRAMPWKRAKALPPPYLGMKLFKAQLRIRWEASEAAGRYIPLVVENVKGAQPWVGRAKAHFGSFYLWGDVESIGGAIVAGGVRFGSTLRAQRAQKFNPDGTEHGQGSWFAVADSKNRGARETAPGSWDLTRDNYNPDHSWVGNKNNGGSWLNIAHNTESGVGNNPDGRKVPGPESRTPQSPENSKSGCGDLAGTGIKQRGSGSEWFDKALDARRKEATAIKNGGDWFGSGENCSAQRKCSSKGNSRKAASAQIAKIPYALSSHIAHVFYPQREVQNGVKPALAAKL